MLITLGDKDEKIRRLKELFTELVNCLEGNSLGADDNSGREIVKYQGREIRKELLVEIDSRALKSCIERLKTEMNITLKY